MIDLNNLINIAIIAGVVIVALFAIGLILVRLYRRATKEVSFVRTGFGGEKVIVNIKTFVDGHKPPDRVIESML